MFETEPIVCLQSLGTPFITLLMILVTKTGSYPFLIAILAAVIFGIDFKKGFLLLQLLLWTALAVEALKILVAFPRPDFVDNRILDLEYGTKSTSPFIGNDTQGILAFPGRQVLTAFRFQDAFIYSSFGFPSGHAALTTALWGGCAIVFKSRTIRTLTPFAVVLVSFSRIYLGRHFIADVVGGAVIGLAALLIFTSLLRSSLKDDIFKKESFKLAFMRQNVIFYCFMFAIPLVLISLSLLTSDVAGLFLGANVAYLLIIRKGIPDDTGSRAQRATRAFIALMLFGVSAFLLDSWLTPEGTINYLSFTLTEFLKTFIPTLTFWVSVLVCTKLGLYER